MPQDYNFCMRKLTAYLKREPLSILLIAIPFAIIASLLDWNPLWVFGLSAAGVIPLAGLIGDGTEGLASHTGPKISGLIHAPRGGSDMRMGNSRIRVGFQSTPPAGGATLG